jgi:TolB-like protein
VFVGRRAGVQQLYLRRLDATEAKPLAGTEGAQVPAVSPDGRFVYGSNRGDDTLAVFAVEPSTGRLTAKGHAPVGGKYPRHFVIDPGGRFVLAAHQNSGTIAVLPLENLSSDPQQDFFADAMTEELITNLGKSSALRVISRTSVMRYKRTKKPLPEIAKELKVDAVVEGTVRRSRDRVRITANLLQARTDNREGQGHHLQPLGSWRQGRDAGCEDQGR